MYIDLIINGVPKRMYFGYIENVSTVGTPNNSFLNKDKAPNIKYKGTSFREILGGNTPTEIKTANGLLFATRGPIQESQVRTNTLTKISSHEEPNKPQTPLPSAIAPSDDTPDIIKYYQYNINTSLTGSNVTVYYGVDTLFITASTSAQSRDIMFFATDEIINGVRTLLMLSDNKYKIINKECGKAYGVTNNTKTFTVWYALNYTIMSINFDINSTIAENYQSGIFLYYLGTLKQAGGRYRELLMDYSPHPQYADFDYGNLIELNDVNKTFYSFHFVNEPNSNFTSIKRGRHITRYNLNYISDVDNPYPPTPEPPTPEPPIIPTPEPENPSDPDNPDNPDNLEPEPSDPVPIPTPSPSPTFTAKLITAYKLSPDNLSALASEMWTSTFYDNIVKMFQNPMDCLISLSEFPIDVPAGVTQNIQLGNVEMSTAGAVVRNPFITVDLGTVEITEKYNSYLDYMNTQLIIYLPFIGFEQISIDYMNSQLQLQYNVDILSGNCVAILYAISYNSNLQSVVGQWNGNMAYSIPLSGRDFSNMASSLWNTAMSAGSVIASSRIPAVAASGFAKGSPSGFGAPSLGSVADLGNNIINTIESANATTSGGHLSANAGHLGVLQPYIIISRPVQKINANYYASYGRILDAYTSFSTLSGFTKVKSCNLFIAGATVDEVREIERLLKEGVIF